jgi:nitroreductase
MIDYRAALKQKGDISMDELNDVMNAIYSRRSTRSYKPEQVKEEDLTLILDAGLWAPTARNTQEIVFVVVQNMELMNEIKVDHAQNDSKGAQIGNFYHGAPTFIFLYGPKESSYSEMTSGIAGENMAIAAEGLGLGSVIIGVIRDYMRSAAGEQWKKRFGLSDDYKFIIGLALGYIQNETPPHPIKRDRVIRI